MRRKILDPMNNQIEVLKVPWYPQQDIEWMCMVNSIKMCLEYMKNTYNNRIIRDIVPNMSVDEIMKITNKVVGPYLTLSSICYERSFEYGGVLPQEYSEIESIFMETYRTEIKRIKLPRYLVQLEAVNILESKTIGGKISWSANENLFNKMCSETDILEPIAGLIEG